MFGLALLAVSITAQSSNVILCIRDFIFLLRVGESIVWSISAWIWETHREWGLSFLSVGSPRSLATSPFPSYSGLLRPVIIRVSCLSLSHVVTFSILVVFTIFFYTASSFVSSLFIFFYPGLSSFCFLNDVSSSIYNLSFGIVHFYVGWVIGLTQFSNILHCTVRGLVLSFGVLGLVSHHFIHLLPMAFITTWVIRPPWGHEISCSLRYISFGRDPATSWSMGCQPTFVSWGYRGIT